MAYLSRKTRRRNRRALQGLGDLTSAIKSIEGALGTGVDVASDPYFDETICHIGQLHAISTGQPVAACAVTPSGLPGGVGLEAAQTPLRFYVYAKQNVWVWPAVVIGLLGLPFFLGYEVGKDMK